MAKPLAAKVEIKGVDHLSTVLRASTLRLRAFGRVAGRFGAPLLKAGGLITGALGVGGVAGVIKSVGDSLDAAGGLNDLSTQLKISTDALQEFRYAGKQVGIESEAMDNALMQMTRRVGELRMGQGSLFTFLSKSNPALAKQARAAKTTDEALDLMIGSLARIKDPMKRAAVAQQMFGKSGGAMVRLLENGAAGLEESRKKAHALGAVMSNETIKALDATGDSIEDTKMSLAGLRNTIVGAAAPALSRLAESTTKWIEANRTEIIDTITTKLREMSEWWTKNKDEVTATASSLWEITKSIASVTASFIRWFAEDPEAKLIAIAGGVVGLKVALMGLSAANPVLAATGLALAGIAASMALIREEKNQIKADQIAGAAADEKTKAGLGALTGSILSVRALNAPERAAGLEQKLGPAIPALNPSGISVGGEVRIVVESSVPMSVQQPKQIGDIPLNLTEIRRNVGVSSMVHRAGRH